MNEQVLEAMIIIYNSVKTDRPLFEFKRWEQLDYDAKMEALENQDWIKKAVKERISLEEARELNSMIYKEVL